MRYVLNRILRRCIRFLCLRKKYISYLIFLVLMTQIFLNIQIGENNHKDNGRKFPDAIVQVTAPPIPENLTFCPKFPSEFRDALNRAKSVTCKQQIIDVGCKYISRHIYSQTLYSTCPLMNKPKILGCFAEAGFSPDYSESQNMDDLTHERCINFCFNRQFRYAHCMNGNICRCGMRYNSYGAIVSNHTLNKTRMTLNSKINVKFDNIRHTKCFDKVCPGNPEQPCGTENAAVTIETGFLNKGQMSFHKLISKHNNMEKMDLVPQIRIVFVFILNGRADRQVVRQIKAMYSPRHYYLIHVDARRQYMYQRLMDSLNPLPPNIRFTPQRFKPIWGGTSLLEVILYCLNLLLYEDAYLSTQWRWDYFINLSESDLLIRPLEALSQLLTRHNGTNFLKAHQESDSSRFIEKQGIEYLFHECDDHLWRLGKKQLISGIAFDGASDWLILTREFSRFLTADGLSRNPFRYPIERLNVSLNPQFVKERKTEFSMGDLDIVQNLKLFYFQSLLPAESFFHTLLLNTRFCQQFATTNLHHIKWRRPSGCTCEYKKFVDWCGCSPHNFRIGDQKRLLKEISSEEYIARKFESLIDQNIVKEVEIQLFGSKYTEVASIDTFWFTIYSALGDDDFDSDLFTVGGNKVKMAYSNVFHRILNSITPKFSNKDQNQTPKYISKSQSKSLSSNCAIRNLETIIITSYNSSIIDTNIIIIVQQELIKADILNYKDEYQGLVLTYQNWYISQTANETIAKDFMLHTLQNENWKDLTTSSVITEKLPFYLTEQFVQFKPSLPIDNKLIQNWDIFKRFEIGERCDFKENFFRNYGHMLSTQSQFRIMAEFKGHASILFHGLNMNKIHLVYCLINPLGYMQHILNATYLVKTKVHEDPISDFDPDAHEMDNYVEFIRPHNVVDQKDHKIIPGVWTVSVILWENLTLLHQQSIYLFPWPASSAIPTMNPFLLPAMQNTILSKEQSIPQFVQTTFLDPLQTFEPKGAFVNCTRSDIDLLAKTIGLPDQYEIGWKTVVNSETLKQSSTIIKMARNPKFRPPYIKETTPSSNTYGNENIALLQYLNPLTIKSVEDRHTAVLQMLQLNSWQTLSHWIDTGIQEIWSVTPGYKTFSTNNHKNKHPILPDPWEGRQSPICIVRPESTYNNYDANKIDKKIRIRNSPIHNLSLKAVLPTNMHDLFHQCYTTQTNDLNSQKSPSHMYCDETYDRNSTKYPAFPWSSYSLDVKSIITAF